MRCSKCGTDNREGRKFCAECGEALASNCPRCGATNESREKFCGECGTALGTSESAAARKSNEPRIRIAKTSPPENLEGERKTVTMLFADIKGSMDMIEDLDPEEARAIVDPALKLMIDAVHHYEGYVAQSTGDGIFALFGAPIAHEDHPQRALHAALRMQGELRRYSDDLRERGLAPLSIRVGVNTGEVVVRTIKTGEAHTEYVPIGHSTSVAARLQALATPGSIAISEPVRKLVEGYFAMKSLGPARIKGVSEPLGIYEVTGLGPLRTRLQRGAARGYTKFVGRQREMETLKHAAGLAQAGHGQIVAAVAEPGVGKSRLFFEFKATSQSGWLVLEAFSVSHGKATAYLPLIELAHSYFKISDEDDQRARRAKVTGNVLTLDRTLEDTLPYLFAMLGIVEGIDPLAGIDGQIRRRRTQDAIKRILLRESLNRPLMLVFEDLHQIDDESQALLNLLADAIGTSRVLLLVNYRPEYSHSWGSKTYYTQVRLDPLGKESADEMLSTLLGNEESVAPLKRLVAEKSEGNPLFMEEIYQALIEEGVLVRNGAVKITRPLNALKIPTTVQAILAARIDRLPLEQKDLLETVAVIGKDFRVRIVSRVVTRPLEELEETLARLQLAEFIYEQPAAGDIEYRFKHQITREVAYNSVLVERRKALHERVAQAIEELNANTLDDHLAEIAYHYEHSTNVPKAVEYLERAGEQARRRSASTEAIAHFRRGVELLPHLPEDRERDEEEARLQNRLAFSLLSEGYSASEARQAYARAKELSEHIGDRRQLFVALAGLANFYRNASDMKKALEVAEELLRMASAAQEPLALLAAHSQVAFTLHELGDFRNSLEHANQGLRAFDSHNRFSPSGEVIGDLEQLLGTARPEQSRLTCFTTGAWDLLWLGYPDQALARCEEALQVAPEWGDPPTPFALFAAAVVHGACGNAKAAQEQAEKVLAFARQNDIPELKAVALGCRGQALVMQGEAEEGLAECRRGLAMAEGTEWLDAIPFLQSWLAICCLMAGKTEEGLEAVAKGFASSDQTGKNAHRTGLYILKGQLLLMQEHEESAAEVCFKTAFDIARSQHAKWFELGATTGLARVLAKQGKRDEARAMLAEIYNWFTEGFDTADLKEAKALLDELGA